MYYPYPEMEWVNGKINGRKVPGFVRRILGGRMLVKTVFAAPKLEEIAENIGKITIEPGKMQIITRKLGRADKE